MKITVLVLCVLVLLVVAYLAYLGQVSKRSGPAGLVDQRLSPCLSPKNCVNTESGLGNDPGEVPIQLPTDLTSDAVAASLQRILEDMGGVVESVQGNYMAATFRSPIFRFVDDFELRIDPASNLLHVRSASRVGTSDMGVNRKRVARFAARVSEL